MSSAGTAIVVTLAAGTLGWFLWFSIAVIVASGIASADDGYFAIIARSFVQGSGYGLPVSSEFVRLFDPAIGSGPGLILPLVGTTVLFGPHSWVPGATVLALFTMQIMVFLALLWRESPLRNVAAFLIAALLPMVFITRFSWAFSFGVGEPIALGWLLIGTAALFGGHAAAAGVLFSLALLTKSITALAIGAVGVVWLAYTRDFRRALTVVLATSALPIAFELYRLAILGLDGYVTNIRETLAFIRHAGRGDVAGSRLDRFVTITNTMLIEPWVAVVLLLSAAVLLQQRVVILFAAFTAAGAAHLAYILLLGRIDMVRYWWIGLACLCVAIAIPALGSAWRAATLAALAITISPYVRSLPNWSSILLTQLRAEGLADQHTAIGAHAAASGLPVVVPSNTTFEVIYLLPTAHPWHQTREIDRLPRTPFLFVARRHFSGDQDRVFAARALCEPDARWPSYEVARCGARFWQGFRTELIN